MRIYIDGPWSKDVREYGSPKRIYLHTRHWLWMIGLWPTIRGQVWTGSEGYTDRYRWIVRHPKLRYHQPEKCNAAIFPGFVAVSTTEGSGSSGEVEWVTRQ